ncbi:carbohydrate kinase family protein [Dactylosporangium sp. NPDC048998]|uniref:carbohydrate kinase family protein n=1 Tax=Dactylosporangium sp. NPDC048998 TaxID=3363976 RepID=UPI0037187EED
MKKITILSHVVMDEIHRPGEDQPLEQIGGAGAYAAVGASLAGPAEQSLIVSGVGRADQPMIATWARSRGIDPRGLFEVDQRSPRTRIDYFEDGERIETPVFGMAHFDAHTPLPRHIPEPSGNLAGVYLFHAHEEPYWDELTRWRRTVSAPILWEISRDSCLPQHLTRVRELAATIDVLSINLTEARELLGRDIDDLPGALAAIAPIVILRCGDRGSLVMEGRERIDVPALPVELVDPTGGGNSYSGAFITGYAATGDLEAAARIAAAAAAVVVSSTGTAAVDDAARAAVAAAARTLTTTRKASA